MTFSILSAIILVPAVSAVLMMLLPERRRELIQPIGLVLSLLPIPLAVLLFINFERGTADFQFVERLVWIEELGVSWHLGVDGISLLLVVLTTILVPISLAASTTITDRVRLFTAMTLLPESRVDRCVPLARPVPLLRVLRSDPGADGAHHRNLG